MALSSLYFLDNKGKIIIGRDYRGDISNSCAEKFISKITELEECGRLSPVVSDEGIILLIILIIK